MMRGSRAGAAATTLGSLAVAVLASCGSERNVLDPTTQIVDGVEVVTLPPMPSPLDPEWAWTFEVVRQISTVDSSGEPIVYEPSRILPLRDGSLFVVDQSSETALVILDPATPGSAIRFGRRGSGPGEMGQGLGLAELGDGTLAVVDRSNRQIHLFARDGTWIRSHALRLETPGDALPLPGRDRYAISLYRETEGAWRRELLTLDPRTGETTDLLTLAEVSPDAPPGRIQRGRHLWAVSTGSIFTMWSWDPEVRVHAHDGTLERRLLLPMNRRTLTEGDIVRQVAEYGDIARSSNVGPIALTNVLYAVSDTVFGLFLTDLWRGAEDPPLTPGVRYWRLFSDRGRYLGVAAVPETFRFLASGSGTVWARLLDEDLVPVIQELRLVRR